MAIATLANLRDAVRQSVHIAKATVGAADTANQYSNYWTAGGLPAAGSETIGNTTNGVVPTDATTGAPSIADFSGTGYLTSVEFHADLQGNQRVVIWDRLFAAGVYGTSSNVTLASQPSYSSRIPNGDYSGTQLWMTAPGPASATVTVTYTDQSGNTGHTTGAIGNGWSNTAKMFQLPLASGDSGLQKIESVTTTAVQTNSITLLVLRPIWWGYVNQLSQTKYIDWAQIGLPIVFQDSCLMMGWINNQGSNNGSNWDITLEIASH